MAPEPTLIPVILASGDHILVEATPTNPDEDVAFDVSTFAPFTAAVAGIASEVAEAFKRVKPKKVVVEFGCEVGYESGKLTAILVKGAGKANFKVTLEWGSTPPE